jgi:hypothetical protein
MRQVLDQDANAPGNIASEGDFTAKFTARFGQPENPQFSGDDDGGQGGPYVLL